ncbi:MAG: cell division protein ZipA C-terminal FtsZ-binding domain-containing protein [Pseudomonadota bacterium]|nr:cell division protein ZipA C-terminal FtsZ-binding domain-containing protein [Pseudomonadota bacterium]
MEFGLREYLLILGAILIIGLLTDGIRRTLKHKREGLKLDLMAAPPESPERSDVSQPRPVKRANPEELEPQVDADPLFDSNDASQLNLWAGEIKADVMKTTDTEALVDPTAADIQTEPLFRGYDERDHQVTTAESVDVYDLDAVDEPIQMRVEPVWDDQPAVDSIESSAVEQPLECEQVGHDEDMRILADGSVSNLIAEPETAGMFGSALGRIFGRFRKQSGEIGETPKLSEDALHAADTLEEKPQTNSESELTDSMDDLVVVRIQSARTPRFEGMNLHKACLRAGLRRTESMMYQRFPLDDAEHPLFSLVNGIEPGTFDDDAQSIDTPVIFLFTELPKQADPVFAVNELISGARSIARDVGGDVFDQQGIPISKEWIDLARAQAGHQNLLRS